MYEFSQSSDQVRRDSANAPPSPEPAAVTPGPASSVIEVVTVPSETGSSKIAEPNGRLVTRALTSAALDEQPTPNGSGVFWLTISASQRRISLPISGKLVLGRFDPSVTLPLDVDLAFEDQEAMTVSRRHARIVGIDGYHTVEDLNSSNGLFINGKQMHTRRAHRLQPGDQVVLGKLRMVYDRVPFEFLEMVSRKTDQLHHFLFHAHNGRKMALSPRGDITIGRFKSSSDNSSKINLVGDGQVATFVSRQHARITWSNHSPLLEDLDSSCGTRLNGKALLPRLTAPLKPGDHISLGGCVLAYDVEV